MFFLALELDIKCVEIEQLRKEESSSTIMQNRRILKYWKDSSGLLATIGTFAFAVRRARANFWKLHELFTAHKEQV